MPDPVDKTISDLPLKAVPSDGDEIVIVDNDGTPVDKKTTIGAIGGGGDPGGSNTQLQYNNSGSFGGIGNVTYNSGTGDLTIASGTNLIPRGSGTNSTEIGSGANASSNLAIAIGHNAAASADSYGSSVTVGAGASASGYGGAVAVGYNASGGSYGTAVGNYATSSGQLSVALGALSTSSAPYAISIGVNSAATHSNSISIGRSAESSATNQVSIGDVSVNALQFGDGSTTVVVDNPLQIGSGNWITISDGGTGGTGSAGAGNQYVELNINGTTYKVLHDGTVA
jgi:trimeric autotransporter adhesin